MARAGILPGTKVGRYRRFRASQLDSWVCTSAHPRIKLRRSEAPIPPHLCSRKDASASHTYDSLWVQTEKCSCLFCVKKGLKLRVSFCAHHRFECGLRLPMK